jgi:ABC-2 type transport system ATP-binding protein
MICGLLKPSSGSIKINRMDIYENIDLIHSFMGVCPQEDIFFEKLTAKEHLKIYGTIKGVPKEEMEDTIQNQLSQVGLTEFQDQFVSEFSGGMKRKLSIAGIPC